MSGVAAPATPERPANVVAAIAAVMRELPAIGKGERSEQGYNYRGIEQVTAHIQALCGKYGIVPVAHVLDVEVRDLTINNRPWTEHHVSVEYDIYGPGGVDDRLPTRAGPFHGLGRDNSDKGINKAMTQAYKYLLIQTFIIGDRKDDGDQERSAEADAPPVRRSPPPRRDNRPHAQPLADPKTVETLIARLNELPEAIRRQAKENWLEKFGKPEALRADQLDDATKLVDEWDPPAASPSKDETAA